MRAYAMARYGGDQAQVDEHMSRWGAQRTRLLQLYAWREDGGATHEVEWTNNARVTAVLVEDVIYYNPQRLSIPSSGADPERRAVALATATFFMTLHEVQHKIGCLSGPRSACLVSAPGDNEERPTYDSTNQFRDSVPSIAPADPGAPGTGQLPMRVLPRAGAAHPHLRTPGDWEHPAAAPETGPGPQGESTEGSQ